MGVFNTVTVFEADLFAMRSRAVTAMSQLGVSVLFCLLFRSMVQKEKPLFSVTFFKKKTIAILTRLESLADFGPRLYV